MIELRGITKAYRTKAGDHVVLDRIDALFPSGQAASGCSSPNQQQLTPPGHTMSGS